LAQYICIGSPYYVGEHFDGRTEVEAIKNSGFHHEIGADWIDIQPDFDAAPHPVTAVNRALADAIARHSDKTPIIFASDCCAALGAIKGLESRQPAVLWYDAHGDFNTDETTPSGFLGGMPLAWLVGRGDQSYMNDLNLAPIAESDVIITDARDLDPEEGENLRASDLIHLTSVNDLLTADLPHKPLYIHFDTDVVDIEDLPGMNYPAPGGPSLQKTTDTLAHVVHNAPTAGLLFSLWNDTLPTNGRARDAVLKIARSFVENNA
jgi:arginase